MSTPADPESIPYWITIPFTASRKLSTDELDVIRRAFHRDSKGLIRRALDRPIQPK